MTLRLEGKRTGWNKFNGGRELERHESWPEQEGRVGATSVPGKGGRWKGGMRPEQKQGNILGRLGQSRLVLEGKEAIERWIWSIQLNLCPK